jgi:lipopolysaccharide biosynthesis glycosyltransferase
MHDVLHGLPVPPGMLELSSDQDITGGIRYGFAEQHFLQVEFQERWTAIDPRFNSMRTNLPHSFGIHWTIGRKPWQNQGNPGHSTSQALWSFAWETLRLHEPAICTELERRELVRSRP